MTTPLYAGIDIGTSGVRISIIDAERHSRAYAATPFASAADSRSPRAWWRAVAMCFARLPQQADLRAVRACAVCGTSGTMLALDAKGELIDEALLYNDQLNDARQWAALQEIAPSDSPARSRSSGLAHAMELRLRAGVHMLAHQADWIAAKLHGGRIVSDENNALKTGFDLSAGCWPAWLESLGFERAFLPETLPAGAPIGEAGPEAIRLGLPPDCVIVAGTTDGCASFLATGATEIGAAVTSLGSTLVLKLAASAPVTAPEFGVYSHRIAGFWLVGGASNSGGGVLQHFFGPRLIELSRHPLADTDDFYNLYPLISKGERFPINDPDYPPRLAPRPDDERAFLQAMLYGMARIEAHGYRLLESLGAEAPTSLCTLGGGAANAAWEQARRRFIDIPFVKPLSSSTAFGAARLALLSQRRAI